MLSMEKSRADGPILRLDGPRWWRDSPRVRKGSYFLVICYLKPRYWIGKQFVADPDLPLYIDEGLRPIKPPTIDQIKSISRFTLCIRSSSSLVLG